MAGGAAKYRHLSRKSSHRQALLRNLVTSLFKHESITTTWPKAKEAQRLAEKLITLGKKNTEASRRRALSVFYVCTPTGSFCQLWPGKKKILGETESLFGHLLPRRRTHRTLFLEDFDKPPWLTSSSDTP
jgi:ribosomal protein L17